MIKAGVITAKVIWNIANKNSGIPPTFDSFSIFRNILSKLPINPVPSPEKARE